MNHWLPTLFVGDAQRHEFRETASALAARGAIAAANIAEAIAVVRGGFSPALIVVAQHWQGQYSPRELDQLRRAAPLARIVRLLGTWMEGEVRTGRPCPATTRTYWHQSPTRLARTLDDVDADGEASWLLPITAGDDERLLAACGDDAAEDAEPDGRRTLLIGICTRQRETAQSLADVCALRGWRTVWLRNPQSLTPVVVDAVLFDAARNTPAEIDSLATWQTATGHAPIITLAGFPRLDEVGHWKQAGVAAVVSKPFVAEDVLWQIEQLTARAPLVV